MQKIFCPRIIKGQEKLTPEQEDYARQFAQERIAAMLSTSAIDENLAEEHLRAAYKVAGLELPKVRWFDSPISFVRASVRASVGASVRDSVRASVGASVRASVGASVRDSVGASVRASVGASVWDSVWASVRDSVGASVRDSVGASVRDSVWASVRASVWDSVRAYLDENWHSFYRFFHETFSQNNLIHLALFNEMVGGYKLGSKEAWLVRKPIILERDDQGRLHSDHGMCMQYRDGWGFYAWHGVRCQEKIILHPGQLTKDDWMNEENLEIRRVIQERMGERFVPLIGGKCINKGTYGRLIQIDLGRDDPERVANYVHVKDTSTERQYYLRVPPTIKRADQGIAWTFGLTEELYCPLQQA
jgi:hypothetical protein